MSRSLLTVTLATLFYAAPTAAQQATTRSGQPIPPSIMEQAERIRGQDDSHREKLENALHWRFKPQREHKRRVSFRETVSISGSKVDGGAVRERWERGYTQQELLRPAGEGWEVAAVLTHTEAFRNGSAESDRLADALIGKELVLHLGAEGRVASVTGVEEALTAIRTELEPAALAGLGERLRPDRVRMQAKNKFRERFIDLLDRPLSEQVWIVHGRTLRTPVAGKLEGVTATRLEGYEERDGVRCARVRVAQGCTPDDFADPGAKAAVKTYFDAAGHPPKAPGGAITGGSSYWFEVETGLMRKIERRMEGDSRRRMAGRA